MGGPDIPVINPITFNLDLHNGKKALIEGKCTITVSMQSVTFGGAGPGTIRWSHILKVIL